MKFNWGTGIYAFLIIFILLLAAFVVFTSRIGVNLVHDNYYEKGLKHDEQLAKVYRSREFKDKIFLHQSEDEINLVFDKSMVSSIDSGHILLYRPSNMHQDIDYKLKLENNHFSMPKKDLNNGRYNFQLTWYANGEEYEYHKDIVVK